MKVKNDFIENFVLSKKSEIIVNIKIGYEIFSFKEIKDPKKVSLKNFPTKPPFPLLSNQKDLLWKELKNRDPIIEYNTMKKKLSKIIINFFFNIKFIPLKNRVIEIKKDINPIVWKRKSESKLPLKPKKFLISLPFEKIKFESSFE